MNGRFLLEERPFCINPFSGEDEGLEAVEVDIESVSEHPCFE